MPNLNTEILSSVPLILPSEPVLTKFNAIATALDARIALNEASSESLGQLRDTLLPKLMSGEIRVRDAEAQLAAIA